MNKKIPSTQNGARYFWFLAAMVAVLFAVSASRDITRPFYGLHSWVRAGTAWRGRCHARYGLGYTKGLMVEAVGYPPPANPVRYVSHPQLAALLNGGAAYLLGADEWVLRLVGIVGGVAGVLLLLRILRPLLGEGRAILAGTFLVLFPISVYFGFGTWTFLAAVLAVWWYFVLIGAITDGPQPKKRHLAGLGIALFVLLQISWSGFFYALAIGVHYVCRCLRRRQWPRWALLAVLIAAPLVSGAVVFLIMAGGMDWNVGRIFEIYKWRSGKAEMQTFTWGAWFERFWDYALLNFTWTSLLLAIAGVAYVLVAHVGKYVQQRTGGKPGRLFDGSPQLMIFLLPAVFQLFLLKGALWKHQYWERPLGPFVAIAAALACGALWDRARKIDKRLAVVAAVLLAVLVVVPCAKGQNYYYAVRWQHPERIRLWKALNKRIPADKALLTFDPELDNLIVTQHKAKGPVIRGEPAWYIDRRIEQVPSKETLDRAFAEPQRIYSQAVQAVQAGRLSREQFQAVMQRELLTALQRGVPLFLPIMMHEIEETRRTGRGSVYLVPGGEFPIPWVNAYLQALVSELRKKYQLVHFFPAQPGEVDGKGEFLKAGMRSYYVFDLSKKPGR
ncbi:MAG TPA: glycosyltransferase family 39 protein [Phycisphaerae bacterium]|nr:glycosyltransferase family 39 protein [Phycisphaerae bacterium]